MARQVASASPDIIEETQRQMAEAGEGDEGMEIVPIVSNVKLSGKSDIVVTTKLLVFDKQGRLVEIRPGSTKTNRIVAVAR